MVLDNNRNGDDDDDDLNVIMTPSVWRELQFGHAINSKSESTSDEEVPNTTTIPQSASSNDPSNKSISDPFAKRRGKTLEFSGISVTTTPIAKGPLCCNKTTSGNNLKDCKVILDNVWGIAPPGETTAIMGPSGAGKTMLLHVLSGRTITNSKLTVQANQVCLNHVRVDPTDIHVRRKIAFVSQDDSLPASSTPRECLLFSAKLRLPRTTTDAEHEAYTQGMLRELGLEQCANVRVGGGVIQGISGGERKRTSVGVELVTQPEMVFLDEPTSGLDSFSAVQLCQVLKRVALSGASVMFTIHQPSSDIFNSFDRLIVLNQGRIMYQGSVNDVDDYFGARNHLLPPKYNPADWIMMVAQSYSMEQLQSDGFFKDGPIPIEEAITINGSAKGQLVREAIESEKRSHVRFGTQFKFLFLREFRSITRDKRILAGRLMLTAFVSVLMGVIFWQVGQTDSANFADLQSHFGAEVMVLMSAMMGTALPALMVFPAERPVFVREYSTNHFHIAPYFVAKLAMEAFLTGVQMLLLSVVSYFMIGFQIAFGWHFLINYALALSSNALAVLLGSLVQNPSMAVEFMPVCFIPQFLFAGLFVRPELIPVWLRWLMYVFPLTYAVRLHMNFEFANCEEGMASQNCEALLANTLVDPDDSWWYWIALVSIFGILRLGALLALYQKASKFY